MDCAINCSCGKLFGNDTKPNDKNPKKLEPTGASGTCDLQERLPASSQLHVLILQMLNHQLVWAPAEPQRQPNQQHTPLQRGKLNGEKHLYLDTWRYVYPICSHNLYSNILGYSL